MKLQWVGCSLKSKTKAQQNDHFGLSNFHRLKFRTNPDQKVSKGDSRSVPLIAAITASATSTTRSDWIARIVLKSIIEDFRHDGRAGILDNDQLDSWVKFKIKDLNSRVEQQAHENSDFLDYSISLSSIIFDKKRAIFSQLGTNIVYLIRKNQVHCLSEGDLLAIDLDSAKGSSLSLSENSSKPYLEQTIRSGFNTPEELTPLICSLDLKSNDMFFFGSAAIGRIFPPEKFASIVGLSRTFGDLQNVVDRISTRTSELEPANSVSALIIKAG